MKEFFFGSRRVTGGFIPNDKTKESLVYFYTIPASFYWKFLWNRWKPRLGYDLSSKGLRLTVNGRYFGFFWKPYCPYFLNKSGKLVKSKRFQFISFKLGENRNKKEMNKLESPSSEFDGKYWWLVFSDEAWASKEMVSYYEGIPIFTSWSVG